MQPVLYADILFVVNAIITFFLINLSADFLRIDSNNRRIILGSIIGGVYSFIIFASEINAILSAIIRILMLISIVFISIKSTSLKKLIKFSVVFIIMSFVFSGIMYSVAFAFLSNKFLIRNGYIYFDIGPIGIIILFSICYISLKLTKKALFVKKNSDFIYELLIRHGKESIRIRALYDSGNNVSDPFTGKPVIIMNTKEMNGLFDINKVNSICRICANNDLSVLPEGIRLLPVKALGQTTLLPAVTVDSATVISDTGEIHIEKPTIAFTDNTMGKNKFSALINENILEGDLSGIV